MEQDGNPVSTKSKSTRELEKFPNMLQAARGNVEENDSKLEETKLYTVLKIFFLLEMPLNNQKVV